MLAVIVALVIAASIAPGTIKAQDKGKPDKGNKEAGAKDKGGDTGGPKGSGGGQHPEPKNDPKKP